MIDDENHTVSPARAQEIEDAIMFGKPHDLQAILEDVADDADFPTELRSGLESLHYFRVHYGQQGDLSSMEKKKVTLMDSSWAMELLNKLRTRIETAVKSA
jgi:hypothetical protein